MKKVRKDLVLIEDVTLFESKARRWPRGMIYLPKWVPKGTYNLILIPK